MVPDVFIGSSRSKVNENRIFELFHGVANFGKKETACYARNRRRHVLPPDQGFLIEKNAKVF
jgi:hypothetical protein